MKLHNSKTKAQVFICYSLNKKLANIEQCFAQDKFLTNQIEVN